MMNNRFTRLLPLLLLLHSPGHAQDGTGLTLQQCYSLAEQHYPIIRQRKLIEQSETYTLSNIEKGLLPQFTANAQATYQSEVTSIKIPIPGIKIDPPSKDQYKFYADISQPLTDLFTAGDQKAYAKASSAMQQSSLETELYKLHERINQLFFGMLLINEQLALNKLVDKDLEVGKKRIEAAIANGVDYRSSLDKMNAELIKNQQRAIELNAQRRAYADMLSWFIDRPVDENTAFVQPSPVAESTAITRPELQLFAMKDKVYDKQLRLIRNKNIPRFSLFLQAGAGKPSPLNMISNSFNPYYLGGIRGSWSIQNLYTQRNDKALLSIERQNNSLQKDLFLFNTTMQQKQQHQELVRLQELIRTDDALVNLRSAIKTTAGVQLENGVISSSDYIRELNAEDQARQNRLAHQLQLLMAQYSLQYTSGN